MLLWVHKAICEQTKKIPFDYNLLLMHEDMCINMITKMSEIKWISTCQAVINIICCEICYTEPDFFPEKNKIKYFGAGEVENL